MFNICWESFGTCNACFTSKKLTLKRSVKPHWKLSVLVPIQEVGSAKFRSWTKYDTLKKLRLFSSRLLFYIIYISCLIKIMRFLDILPWSWTNQKVLEMDGNGCFLQEDWLLPICLKVSMNPWNLGRMLTVSPGILATSCVGCLVWCYWRGLAIDVRRGAGRWWDWDFIWVYIEYTLGVSPTH